MGTMTKQTSLVDFKGGKLIGNMPLSSGGDDLLHNTNLSQFIGHRQTCVAFCLSIK